MEITIDGGKVRVSCDEHSRTGLNGDPERPQIAFVDMRDTVLVTLDRRQLAELRDKILAFFGDH